MRCATIFLFILVIYPLQCRAYNNNNNNNNDDWGKINSIKFLSDKNLFII